MAAAATTADEQQAAIKSMYRQDWDAAPPAAAPTSVQSLAEGTSTTENGVGTPPGTVIYFGQIYGLREANQGLPIGCNIEIVTDTPAATLGIRYGLALQCNDPSITGKGISHLGEVYPTPLRPLQAGSFFDINGTNQFHWQTQRYLRESDLQMEQIYAFFSVDINTPTGQWKTTPTVGGAAYDIQCSPTEQRRITCVIVTGAFPFLPTDGNCSTGGLCGPAADTCSTPRALVAATGATRAALDDAGGLDDSSVPTGDPDDEPGDGVELPVTDVWDPESVTYGNPQIVTRSIAACSASDSLRRLITSRQARYCGKVFAGAINPIIAAFMVSRAKACAKSALAAHQAQREAAARFTKRRERYNGGPMDAFRHCAWNGRMVHLSGEKWAKKFSDLNEDPNDHSESREIDEFNNGAGRGYGKLSKDQDNRAWRLYDTCEAAARDGILRTLAPPTS